MAGPGFGTGLALQGQPALHGQYYNQRKNAEDAAKNAKIKRDDEVYQDLMKTVSITPDKVDWKYATEAQKAVTDYAHEATRIRQERPQTWENEIFQLKQQTIAKLAGIYSSSQQIKNVREADAKGEILAPEALRKFLNTGQGDFKSNRPSLAEQKLYGITIDEETGVMGFNPVKKVDLTKLIHSEISNQEKSFQDVVDPATGKPKIFSYGPGGIEKQTRRALLPGQIDNTYESMITNPDIAQNFTLSYYNELKKDPNFTEEMVINPDGTFKETFLQGVDKYGRDIAHSIASKYYTTNEIAKPNVTNVVINNGSTRLGNGVSAITPAVIKVGLPASVDKDGDFVYDDANVVTEAQFTTPNFQVQGATSGTVYDITTNKQITEPGVENTEYSQFAVIPVFKSGKDKGRAIPESFKIGKDGKPRTSKEVIDNGEAEWKVVAVGAYKKGTGQDAVPMSVYRDANEVVSSAATKLPEGDEVNFNARISEQYAFAKAKNEGFRGSFEEFQEKGWTPKGNKNSVKTSSSTLQDRKGNPNKPKIPGF